jgi:hypothetical protein
MKKNKRVSLKSRSYLRRGEFWDSHDLSDYWEKTKPVHFDVRLETERSYFGVEKKLSEKIFRIAKERGISSHTMVNLLLQEQLAKTA